MIKCRTWAPLRQTYSQHKTTEDALEYVLDMIDELIDSIDFSVQKNAEQLYNMLTSEQNVNKMYTLFDTRILDRIKNRK